MRIILAIAAALALSVGVPTSGYGATISGTLNTTGSARVTQTTIDFLPLAGGQGNFNIPIDDPGTGTFATLADQGEVDGVIKDLNLPGDPVGSIFSKLDFMTFVGYPGLSFELTFIEPGVSGAGDCFAPAAAGQICTPVGSPFNLQNTSANSSTASFNVSGNVTDGSGDVSTFTGTLTTQFDNRNYQSVLNDIFGPNGPGFVQASYSGQFTVVAGDIPPIPEPASIFLLGAGVLGLSFIKRRR
jgi:hypothetical protein